MLDPEGRELRDELLTLFAGGAVEPPMPGAFEALAPRVFEYNYRHVPAYAAYCRARGRAPGDGADWSRIPAVPTAAFKEIPLKAQGARAERVFRTSGTTRGPERRGEHHVPDLDLYRASLRPAFEAFLLPDGRALRFLSLVPPADRQPDSSLSFMVDDVVDALGGEGSASFATPDGIDFDALDDAVGEAMARGVPVLVLGTSAAFVHWLDRMARAGRRHALPDGSRLMDTGGYKGRGRDVAPDALQRAYGHRLAVPAHACVNEYGMTEMLSQLYDTTLRDHQLRRDRPARKAGPWWVRSVAVDPDTLEPLPPGSAGLLRHMDLANIGSIAAIQTEDFGSVDEHGVVVTGRAAGAAPRGCSIAMDLLLGGAP